MTFWILISYLFQEFLVGNCSNLASFSLWRKISLQPKVFGMQPKVFGKKKENGMYKNDCVQHTLFQTFSMLLRLLLFFGQHVFVEAFML